MEKQAQSKKRAYRALAGSILIVSLIYGVYGVLSNYLVPLSEKVGCSIAEIVTIFTFIQIASALINFAIAATIDRIKIKYILLFGCVCFIGAFILLAFASSLTMVYAAGILFGISTSCCGYTGLQPVIMWWFSQGAGKKISYLSIGLSICSMILSPVMVSLIAKQGLTTTALAVAVVLGGLMVVATVLLISERPDRYELKPFGFVEVSGDGASFGPISGLSFKQAIRTFPFWAIALVGFLGTLCTNGYTGNAAAIYQSYGMSASQAGLMISIYSFACILWNFLYGVLNDKLGPRKAAIVYGVAITVVFVILYVLLDSFTAIGLYAMALFIGIIQYGSSMPAMNLGNMFGFKSFGAMNSICMVVAALGGMVGPVAAAKVYGDTGSYTRALIGGAAMMVVAVLLTVTGTSKRQKEKMQLLEKSEN